MKQILIIIIVFLFNCIQAQNIKPEYRVKASADVSDFVLSDSKIYIGTVNGTIEIYDYQSRKKLEQLSFEKIKDFTGETIFPAIYSVDKFPGKDKIITVVQGNGGYQNVYLIENGKKINLINADKDKLMVKKVLFHTENLILLGLYSNEFILYDTKTHKKLYNIQISQSPLSDFILDKTRKLIISCDESGATYLINASLGRVIKKYEGIIKDRSFSVDFKNNIFITGGKDEQTVIHYLDNREPYSMKSNFQVYSVALSPLAKFGAFLYNEKGDIYIFDISNRQKIGILDGEQENISKIVFKDESHIVSASRNKFIKIWNLKQ